MTLAIARGISSSSAQPRRPALALSIDVHTSPCPCTHASKVGVHTASVLCVSLRACLPVHSGDGRRLEYGAQLLAHGEVGPVDKAHDR